MEKVKLLISCLTDKQLEELYDRMNKIMSVTKEYEKYDEIVELLLNERKKRYNYACEEKAKLNKK